MSIIPGAITLAILYLAGTGLPHLLWLGTLLWGSTLLMFTFVDVPEYHRTRRRYWFDHAILFGALAITLTTTLIFLSNWI